MIEGLEVEYEVVEERDDRVVRKVSSCPYNDYWSKADAPKEVCNIWCTLDQEVNPNPTIYHTKSLFEGDPYCL